MVLLLVNIAAGLEMCTDTIEINANCTMITPALECGNYTYQVINMSGDVVTEDSLSLLSGNIYQFNFTEPEGEYVIEYCDNSTRQVRKIQEDENKMIIAALILIPLFLGIFFLVGAATLSEDHAPVRIFLFLLSIVTFFTSCHMAMAAIVEFYNFTAMQEIIGTTTYWVGWVFFALISYFIIYAIRWVFLYMGQQKAERLEY